MTIGTRASSSPSSRGKTKALHCVSAKGEEDLQHQQSAQENEALLKPNQTPSKCTRSSSGSITRQVSHDGLSDKPTDKMDGASASDRASPIRCVSEFDKISSVPTKHAETDILENSTSDNCVPPSLPNPLHNQSMLEHHSMALRLEAQLHPMRLILSRLMAHLTFNRHGIFNSPVDPVALGLPDYFTIIKKPMDLGTVRKRLHSYEYNTRRECAEDIRLCLRNAMTYNPPNNLVHNSAKDLLAFFEDQMASFCPELAALEDVKLCNPCAPSLSDKLETIVETAPSNAAPSLCATACAPSHAPGTRKSATGDLLNPPTATMLSRKRRKRGSKVCKEHNCQWCNGSTCVICEQGCLSLEPTLLICNGPQCSGAKIRKGVTYYISPDGSFQFCQRCHAGLSAILPHANKLEDESICRYKRNLLKRKNDEEVVESWVQCSRCQSSVHQFCAMYNSYVHSVENYLCPGCVGADSVGKDKPLEAKSKSNDADAFTFVSGSELPVAVSDIANLPSEDVFGASSLPATALSSFIEEKVKERLGLSGIPNADKTVLVRVISDCDRRFKVPEVVRNHFDMCASRDSNGGRIAPPSIVKYRSKAIALFQKIDGFDVCIFCMYVHEYDGEQDEFDSESDKVHVSQQKRVYIAYLDSVEYFRPRSSRTEVYHEVLSAYLATARKRGFETAHIWACPPLRGNSFVFWNHPAAQRTPNMERLTAWYHGALSRSIDCGIVTDVKSLYESDFQACIDQIDADEASGANPSLSKIPCPPLLDGDFWVEEAVRLHAVANERLSRDYVCCDSVALSSRNPDGAIDPCPAVQVSTMLLDKIIALPSALAFRRPVNAAALKLKDYHTIITKPMDLGTVHSRCALGEYRTLAELVADVDLVFANAKKYNPIGHIVHQFAVDLLAIFETELNEITKDWGEPVVQKKSSHSWRDFADTSLSLNVTLNHLEGLALVDVPPLNAGADSHFTTVSAISDSVSVPRTNVGVCSVQQKTSSAAAHEKRMTDLRAGPQAVLQRMAGGDDWLLDKNPSPPKDSKKFKRKKSGGDSLDEPGPKRRRQSWLGEEVGNSVRRARTSLFQCSLLAPEASTDLSNSQLQAFKAYTKSYNATKDNESLPHPSPASDARHSLLEFSQFRNLEFDTLRRAKYSSAILLYHLHNHDAPGLIPECTSCCRPIEGIRWHKMMKVVERQRRAPKSASTKGRKPSAASLQPFVAEELCSSCYSEHKHPNEFIPLQVSIQKRN